MKQALFPGPARLCCVWLCCAWLCCVLSGCSPDKPQAQERPAPLVGVMTVKAQDTPFTTTFVGQTEGSRAVEVQAQVSGILTSRAYEEGQFVEEGQLLFTIEPDTYKAALAQAEAVKAQAQAKFTQAQRDLNRIRPLYAKNAVSQRDRDQAESAYNAAKADLEAASAAVDDARIKLGHATVTAPVSGFTSKEDRSVGNLITAGGPDSRLTVINAIDPIYANFSVPSPQYMHLRVLMAQGRIKMMDKIVASLELADGTMYSVKGRINFVDMQINPGTSVVAARAAFDNKRHIVLPGQFVRVVLSGAELVDAILIPQQAVLQTQQGSMVVVLDDQNIASMRKVKLGEIYGDRFLVEEGLKDGERIVVEGNSKAVPGKPVRIAAADPRAGEAAAGQTGSQLGTADKDQAGQDDQAARNEADQTEAQAGQDESDQTGQTEGQAGQGESDQTGQAEVQADQTGPDQADQAADQPAEPKDGGQ